MNLLDEAIAWVCRGVAVLPIQYREKKPDAGALWFVGSRNALGHGAWEPFKARLPDHRELIPWFGTTRRRNIGIITGWRGLTILDFDDWTAYADWRAWAATAGGHAARAAESYQVATSRGVHVYVFAADGGASFDRPGLNVLGKGLYALGAGSIHPSGAHYTALDARAEPVHVPSVRVILPPYTEQPTVKAAPASTAARADYPDPWRQLDSINQYGNGLMQAAKDAVLIQDLLPGWYPSGDNKNGESCGMARCPLHDDQNPSLSINLLRQIAVCWAGCNRGKPLDAINLVALRDGRSLRDAALYLLNGGR